jgi:GTPase SAR1 family protein
LILSPYQISGKTNTLRALSGMPFVNDTGPTIIDFSIIKMTKKNMNIKLQIWDTSSHPINQQIVNTYVKSLQ